MVHLTDCDLPPAELAESVDGPSGDRPQDAVAPPDQHERPAESSPSPGLQIELDEASRAEIVANDVLRHVPPAEPGRDERVLRREIDHAPRSRRQHAVIIRALLAVAPVLAEHDLHGPRE